MARVLGLGGLFFKSDDPDGTREWYGRVLGIAFDDWGGTVFLPETAAALVAPMDVMDTEADSGLVDTVESRDL